MRIVAYVLSICIFWFPTNLPVVPYESNDGTTHVSTRLASCPSLFHWICKWPK